MVRWCSPLRVGRYATIGQKTNRTMLGLRVKQGGKIDIRVRRAAAASSVPLLGWVGGKAWWFVGCSTENGSVTPPK
jgi:hypothetical protein